jgi:hypothetical protein
VTFSPTTAAAPNATFNLASVNSGTCHVTVTDTYGQTAVELVNVTITNGSISAKRR